MKEREVEINKEVKNYPQEKENIEKYLQQLNEIEWKAFILARKILKTSFIMLN
jgi:hypothetical protein